MKRWILGLGAVVVMLGLYIFINKPYYPSLPIENITPKEAIKTLSASNENIAQIAEDNDYRWYLTKKDNGNAYDNLKELMRKEGWTFKTQEGSGYFFEKGTDTLIVTAKMWTSKYVIVKVPTYNVVK